MLVCSFPFASNAVNEPQKKSEPISAPAVPNESMLLMLRLDEINAMDKSDMSAAEKKALRKEVKSISARNSNGGVYISVGGVIIILLLLIILF
jgi:hypothetical protein